MLVFSREPGTSIIITSLDETCLVTVLEIFPERRSVSMLFNRASTSHPGALESHSLEVAVDAALKVSGKLEIVVADLRGDKVRIGVSAPKEFSIHRLEVYEAIRRGQWGGPNPEDGTAGSPTPRPQTPKPPTLDVRLDEPSEG